MTALSPADGPIAVTGASGYIGAWIVRDLMVSGYTVRACVRDSSRPEKVDHLLALNEETQLRGQLTLHEADLQRLVGVLRELAARGDLVVMAEHRLSLIAACDHVVDLGPSSGAAGGDLVACGPPGSLERGATAAALRAR